jgi:anti-sigma B factor antagonist
MELSLSTSTVEGHVVLHVGGELDARTGPRLREAFTGLVDGGARRVLVDITRLEFLDSAGLGVMTEAFHRLRAAGGTFAVVTPSERTLKIFRTAGTDRVPPVFESVRAAVEHGPPASSGADATAPPRKRTAGQVRPAAAKTRRARPAQRSEPDPPATDPDGFTLPSWFDKSRLDFFRAVYEAGTGSVADLADIFKISEAEVRRILRTIEADRTP